MIIDGRALAEKIYTDIQSKNLKDIKLAIILANNDEASRKYTDLKKKAGERIGIKVDIYSFDEKISKNELILKIVELNNDLTVDGIVVQLPLYQHLEEVTIEILNNIEPKKDADSLTSSSLASTFNYSKDSIMPAAVEATMISLAEIVPLNELEGKNIVIINNSNLVGNPMAIALSRLNATVTLAHKFTKDLKSLISNADVIISATGVTNIISANEVKDDVILIDITSVSQNGKTLGDFVYDQDLIRKAKAYTPVPGGIGPLTVASLFKNLVKLVNQNG